MCFKDQKKISPPAGRSVQIPCLTLRQCLGQNYSSLTWTERWITDTSSLRLQRHYMLLFVSRGTKGYLRRQLLSRPGLPLYASLTWAAAVDLLPFALSSSKQVLLPDGRVSRWSGRNRMAQEKEGRRGAFGWDFTGTLASFSSLNSVPFLTKNSLYGNSSGSAERCYWFCFN